MLDLGIAVATGAAGAAGAYVLIRKEAGSALPGVGIAVALVPPLATVGLTLGLVVYLVPMSSGDKVTDIGRSISVIAEALEPFWLSPPDDIILLEAPQVLGVQELGENGVVIRVSIAAHPDSLWTGARHARRLIKDAFDAEGITIPFPQRRVWFEAQSPSLGPALDE